MRRRTSLAAALAIGTAWAAAACGIPTGRDPEVIDDAPTDFGESSGISPETFEPTTDAGETVRNFLKAAAGDPDGRDDRLNLFTASRNEEFSEASSGISLIDGVTIAIEGGGNPIESATVTVTGTIIGAYEEGGSVRMRAPIPYEETFMLRRDGGLQDTWEIQSQPSQVSLDYQYFLDAYTESPLYFQAEQAELLVPDLRWVYGDLEAERRRQLQLDWLLSGPTEFASLSARSAIPNRTTGSISSRDGAIEIDLALGEPVDDRAAEEAMAAQVAWSLGLTEDFALIADGNTVAEGSLEDWRGWNAIPENLPQTAYFIFEQTVWEYSGDEVSSASAEHPWVGFTAPGLQEVAVGPAGQIAAVVAGGSGVVLQTGPTGESLGAVEGLGSELTDPQWHPDAAVIVVSDGVPTVVDPNTRTAVQGLTVGEHVTAMSLSADGRRLAYVEDGHAWVAPLKVDADKNLQAGEPRRIGGDVEAVTDVAWSSENYLWVAGQRGNDTLFTIAIDNSRTTAQPDTSGLVFSEIAANPADPVESILNRGDPVLAVANQTLYRIHTASGPTGVRNGNAAVGGSAPFTVVQ
ncbi:LpqB family beta-propeller domain-containing protein [Glycomyces terrestris]|uniref:Lipoprotein LpqB beta-propeller domain-containing protein n=1 Tax=Glycomyces terrestris TaxID=2493553 RepID=A0A426UUF4_9ACTN|nr:LpqB family beta-propeller domain-containing protein [Glycomyces terrestris]RRR97623.1 hypothetical protein EIW28_19755 [Glycomyces terrestris]